MRWSSSAYTLVELLLVLAVLAMLAGLALPGLRQDLRDQVAATTLQELARSMALARSAAVTHGRMATLCGSSDGNSCGGDWNSGHLVFLDADGNGRRDAADELLLVRTTLPGHGSLLLRSFPNRQYVQYTAEGFSNRQNGSFTWCPLEQDARAARQLIFSQSGRVRFARDRNGDGVVEGSDGKAVACTP